MDAEGIAKDLTERVREVVAGAEERARQIVAGAEEEAAAIVERAREQAREQVARAEDAIASLATEAQRLHEQLAEVEVGTEAPSSEVPGPVTVPEPAPPPTPEPTPDPVPDPVPGPQPVPEPGPQPVPEPTPPPDEGDPPSPGGASGDRPSTEELLERLRAGGKPTPKRARGRAKSTAPKPARGRKKGTVDDKTAARLVAMKMALDGSSRDEIDAHLAANYDLAHRDKLLDDVLVRAKA